MRAPMSHPHHPPPGCRRPKPDPTTPGTRPGISLRSPTARSAKSRPQTYTTVGHFSTDARARDLRLADNQQRPNFPTRRGSPRSAPPPAQRGDQGMRRSAC
jgi:hypothetical protein